MDILSYWWMDDSTQPKGSYEGLKWTKDASGQTVMPEVQSDYLDWLISDDKFPDTENEWCQLNGVNRSTAKKWRQDRRFREQWERRAIDKNISPDRIQRVLDTLYQSAVGTGDTQAAKQWLLYVEKLLAPKQQKGDSSVAHMTDAELVAEIEGIIVAGFGFSRSEGGGGDQAAVTTASDPAGGLEAPGRPSEAA